MILFIICGVVKPLSSLPSCLLILKKKNEKKNFSRGRNEGDITLGIREGSTL
jgi:hypothetical protein